jgi:Mrp family chromosome partitioning ATPase
MTLEAFGERPHARSSAWPWLLGVLVALLVFAGFQAYISTLAKYRASAELIIEPTPGSVALPSVADITHTFRESALSPAAIQEIGASNTAPPETRQSLEPRLSIQPHGDYSFSFFLVDPHGERARDVCNALSGYVARHVLVLLAPKAAESPAEAERRKRAADLAAFLQEHPEVATSPAPNSDEQAARAARQASLRAERDQLKARISQLAGPPSDASDNPFDAQSANPEVQRLSRRLDEIQSLLSEKKRPAAPTVAPVPPKVDPAVEREWLRLLAATAQTPAPEAAPSAAPFTVKLASATVRKEPLTPQQRMLSLVGLATALLCGVGAGFGSTLKRGRPSGAADLESSYRASEHPAPLSPGSNPPGASEPAIRGGDQPWGTGTLVMTDESFRAAGNDAPARVLGADSNPPPNGDDTAAPRRTSSNPPADNAAHPAPATTSSNPPPDARRPPTTPSPVIRVEAGQEQQAPRLSPDLATTELQAAAPAPRQAATVLAPTPAPATSPFAPVPIIPAPIRTPSAPAPAPATEARSEVRSPVPPAPAPEVRPATRSPVPPTQEVAVATIVSGPTPPYGRSTSPAPGALAATLPHRDSKPTVPPPPPDFGQQQARNATSAGPAPHPTISGPFSPTPSERGSERTEPRSPRRRPGRTTQMLGSPIPPTIQGENPSPPPVRTTRPPLSPRGTTSYSYVSSQPPPRLPEGRHPVTPPYFSEYASPPPQGQTPRYPEASPTKDPSAPTDAQRPRIHAHRVHLGWSPDPAVHPEDRRALCQPLFSLAVEGSIVIGVTGVPECRTHKSRIAAELALALAETRTARVLLMEADFHWPAVHQVMHVEMPMSAGLSQQLRRHGQDPTQPWIVLECSQTLHVLAEGVMRSPGLILSTHFEDSLRSFRSVYDFIVIDGPQSSSEVECRALDFSIDGHIIVSPEGGSPWLSQALGLFTEKRFSTVVGVKV